jgi:ABC-type Na+ efflux pump permease subunit
MPSNFLMESILSDKRNQTFERYFVSGNIKEIMFAKLSAMSIFGIVPFIMFYVYLLINGINIIDTFYMALNTPLYFWIALCMITAVTFPFSNENSVAFAGLPCMLVMIGIIIAYDYIGANYHPAFTCFITISCAVIVTIIAYKIYKNTKYFLKI